MNSRRTPSQVRAVTITIGVIIVIKIWCCKKIVDAVLPINAVEVKDLESDEDEPIKAEEVKDQESDEIEPINAMKLVPVQPVENRKRRGNWNYLPLFTYIPIMMTIICMAHAKESSSSIPFIQVTIGDRGVAAQWDSYHCCYNCM